MSKEETPVEWLVEQLNEKAIIGGTVDRVVMNYIIEQAKQMEEENLERLKDFDTWKEWKNKPSK